MKSSRIEILDGIRAYSMLLIMGFHIWQQSWLQNLIPSDILAPIGIHNFSLAFICRTGYVFVDVLLLLSAMCLTLPYVGQSSAFRVFDTAAFYKKRLIRILPPYLLCIAIYAVFIVRPNDYTSARPYFEDLLSHLTFTHTFSEAVCFGTKYPTSLWTLCIEMQFYLIFPMLLHFFRRFPVRTWLMLQMISELFFALFVRTEDGGADNMLINQLPAFLGVFANGMLCARLYHSITETVNRDNRRAISLLGTLISVFSIITVVCMLRDGLNRAESVQRWQIDYRFIFSVVICVLILSLSQAGGALRILFSAKPLRFTAAISYNLYIWHVPVMLELKKLHIPPYPTPEAAVTAWPQSAAGEPWHREWQIKYTLLFWLISFIIAAVLTWVFDIITEKCVNQIKQKEQT